MGVSQRNLVGFELVSNGLVFVCWGLSGSADYALIPRCSDCLD